MSELFDFLRKSEVSGKTHVGSSLPPDSPTHVAPIRSNEGDYGRRTPQPEGTSADRDVPCTFDLSNASDQFKGVLDPLSIIGEQFRALRTRLTLLQKQTGFKTILIASTVPDEGKSFTACGLAGVIAQEAGKKVVVIDGDMRKPGSGRDLGVSGNGGSVGTAQVLQGETGFHSALLAMRDPQFWFMPSGALPTNPSELLSSPAMEKLIRTAAESFDWVIVDSPPVLALSDASIIAPLCDTALLVVRANSTSAKLVRETINKIGKDRFCGTVLNRQAQMPTSKYYYQYYYRSSKTKAK